MSANPQVTSTHPPPYPSNPSPANAMSAAASMPTPSPAPATSAPRNPETAQLAKNAPVTMPMPAPQCSPGCPGAVSREQQSAAVAPKTSQPIPPQVHQAQNQGPPPPMYAAAPPPMGPQPVITNVALGSQYQAELFGRCARGYHEPTTKFGPCGIITAIFCFPIGLLCLFADRHKQCARCGAHLA
ncbi:hypothetical protein NLJ89_g2065 [Agrocybe chaxingu]|uniref:Brain protein I3 n=1 Tax=Agrocybe chaxingu TaxID=84603 RepID=A0A9W8K850_9AGAR|nr:hypothetical protein NLJ89_g2065 [Agrocybe chaxingu]